jgi:geranylgeranyl diphosphate synthase type I
LLKLPEVFARHQAEIDQEMRSVLNERRSPLYDMMRYHFGWIDENGCPQWGSGGKAVRPTLCLLACTALGGRHRRALPAAAAIEFVHNYSLIHDDIQDDDRERRHRATVWSVWGKPQAINAGTGMRMLANSALRRLDIPLSLQAHLHYLLDEATIRLIEGQYLDISYEGRFDITVADYVDMVGGKTAALFACALEIGSAMASEDAMDAKAFHEFGWNLGMAFQVRDDMLGIWGRAEETGKPSCNDLRRRKKTLPVVHALERATGLQREELLRYYGRPGADDESVNRVLEVLEVVGAFDESRRLAQSYIDTAKHAIASLSLEPSAARDIGEVVEFLETRRF